VQCGPAIVVVKSSTRIPARASGIVPPHRAGVGNQLLRQSRNIRPVPQLPGDKISLNINLFDFDIDEVDHRGAKSLVSPPPGVCRAD
jgi:hypothetical protein